MAEENVAKLPLWRTCVEKMAEQGLFYGKTYSIEWFEGQLKVGRASPRFSFGIYRIRRELETRGFYLSGIGASKNGFYTLQQANANLETIGRHNKRARRYLQRSVVLAMTTEREMLKPAERIKLEQITERQQLRLMFMRRSNMVARALGGAIKAKALLAKLEEQAAGGKGQQG